jgi:predicted alpha/beta-fold hydrolase
MVRPNRFRPEKPFLPQRPARSGAVQTALARMRPKEIDRFTRFEQPILLDAGPDMTGMDPNKSVRLLGYYSRTAAVERRGLVMTLHGWEGCSHSNYNLVVSSKLLDAGYDVLRLNLRDHGPGYHTDPYRLNKGIFLGSLIEEVAAATHRVAEMAGDLPFFIVGASMGGNFALRLAALHNRQPFHNLQRVVAISPAINPSSSTKKLDAHPVYQRYFKKRWVGSIRAKEVRFPELYDFSDIDMNASIYEVTDRLIRKFGLFDSADAYFKTYTLTGDSLASVTVPTSILTAVNDAIIPAAEFYTLPANPRLNIELHPSGGHVGFVDIMPLRHRLPEMVLAQLL